MPVDPSFVHLHLHSEYSLVDGLLRIKPLAKRVVELGMPAVAITDQGNLFALVRFYKAAIAAGLKPIAGADLWVRNPDDPSKPHRLVLLVQDAAGYRNLTRLISRAYVEGQHLGMPQVEREWIEQANAGLIALSGGPEGDVAQCLLNGQVECAERLLARWLAVFGDRYYLELVRTGRALEAELIETSVDLAIRMGVPVVATNDVRFLAPADFDAHEVRVCIHEGRTLDDPRRVRRYSAEQYLRSPAEMAELFADLPEALENTVEIAKRCNLELTLGKSFLPDFPVPRGMTLDEYFTKASRAGLAERLAHGIAADAPDAEAQRRRYDERLDLELAVIIQMGFPGYFLIVADFIQWAKSKGIPVGPGRGSGAGSLVAYALKITDLDPIEHDLLFERFLNPERVSMPDFDVDFCMEGRDQVIDYVARKYGRDAVSQIITFGTMAAKAVVRDVGRVMGHPYGFVDKVAKMVPFELGMTLEKALAESDDLKAAYQDDEEIRALIDMARKLEGLARNAGKHAGGVVIAPTVLTDFAPLYCEPGGENLVTQFDKDDVEQVGLVKFDFLGLRTLTIIDWALKTINAERAAKGEASLDIERIDPHDEAAFALLKRCETTAVFQLESRGMKELIKKLQPDSFGDITALVALFRPGPLQSGMVDDFINRKHGRAEVVYPHPELEPILKPTYGIILYQEQVMQIAQVLAGYSLGGADILRRCLAGATRLIDAATGDSVTLARIAAAPAYWVGREVLVLDPDALKIVRQPIEAIYHNGVQEVFELTTRAGRRIQATATHLFHTPMGWKPLAAFQPGEAIGAAATAALEPDSTMPDFLWDHIESIHSVGRMEVFDLTIPCHHNFIANDLVAHNCMGKKKPEEMAQQREIFLKGSVDRRVELEQASHIFDLMEYFSGYGFNKSHSAAYALVSYQTLWLKAHHPAAFMAAVLSADMDNTDKVVTLIEECRAQRLKVEPPAINRSEYRFTVADASTIVYGMGAIKGVGSSAIESIVQVRATAGPFRDLWDLCRRIDAHKVNRRVLEALIRAGALDALGPNRATLMADLPQALKLAEQHHATREAGQADLFGMLEPVAAAAPDPQLVTEARPDWEDEQRLAGEKETLGLYLTGHPIDRYESELQAMGVTRIAKLLETDRELGRRDRREREKRSLAGLVVAVRHGKTQRGRMGSVLLDDRTGRIEITFFSELYEQSRQLLVSDQILQVNGVLSYDEYRDGWSIRADDARTLEQARAAQADHLSLTLDLSDPVAHAVGLARLAALRDLLAAFRDGDLPVRLRYRRPGVVGELLLGDAWRVEPSDALLKRLRQLLGATAVTVVYERTRVSTARAEPAAVPRLAAVG